MLTDRGMSTQANHSVGSFRTRGTFWCLVLGLLLAFGARAAVITYSFTTSHEVPPWSYLEGDPDPAWQQTLPQFDSSLGELTQVSITLTAYLSASIGLENTTTGQGNLVTGTLASSLTLVQGSRDRKSTRLNSSH